MPRPDPIPTDASAGRPAPALTRRGLVALSAVAATTLGPDCAAAQNINPVPPGSEPVLGSYAKLVGGGAPLLPTRRLPSGRRCRRPGATSAPPRSSLPSTASAAAPTGASAPPPTRSSTSRCSRRRRRTRSTATTTGTAPAAAAFGPTRVRRRREQRRGAGRALAPGDAQRFARRRGGAGHACGHQAASRPRRPPLRRVPCTAPHPHGGPANLQTFGTGWNRRLCALPFQAM